MSAGAALGGHVAARLDLAKVDTPAYVTDLGALEDNLKLLASVMERAGVTIILALKGFAQWSTFPLVKRYLKGTTCTEYAALVYLFQESKLAGQLTPVPIYVEALAYRQHRQHQIRDPIKRCCRCCCRPRG